MPQLQVTIRQVLEGDREAYQRIVRRYEDMLVTYVSLRVPDKSLVDELVLDTFVQAYELLDHFRLDEDFGGWLRTLCRYRILTELKRANREKAMHERYTAALRPRLLEKAALLLEQEPEPSDEHRALESCLKKLPAHSRELLAWRYEKDKSSREIAQQKDRSVTWVTTTLCRIRKMLRQCIQSAMAEEAAP